MAEDSGLFWFRERRLRGELVDLCSFLRKGHRGEGAGLFSLGFNVRIHGSGPKLLSVRFRLDVRRHFYTERVIKHWKKLPREAPKPFNIIMP